MEVNSWMETAKWQGLCIVPIIFVVALVAASTRLIASGGDLQLSDSPLDQDPLISSYEDNRNLGSRGLKIFNSSREKSATCSSSSSFDPAGCSQDLLPTRNESSLSSSLSTSLPSPPSPAGEQQGRDYHLELPTSSPTSNLNFKEREGGHEEGQQQEPHSLPSLAERIRSEEACYRAHCVRAAHNPENKAVAFALYGGAFRTGTTGGGVGYSCNRNGFEAQRAVYQSHVANVLSQFQKLDYSVDIFLIPYPCYNKNNQSYTESLHSWYAPVAFKVYSENMPTEKGLVRAKATNAVTSVDRRNGVIVEAINMIFAHENVTSSSYRFALLMRLDTMIGSPITDFLETKFSRFDQNVFENGKPQVSKCRRPLLTESPRYDHRNQPNQIKYDETYDEKLSGLSYGKYAADTKVHAFVCKETV
mmetsp:Transcript_28195/g.38950  ORF Transcript_28195/g.38950 Transcript_28195/m.38950 type:complete len:418 (+) Transcript_28195:100-1353(+)